jgi:hypothetical protein
LELSSVSSLPFLPSFLTSSPHYNTIFEHTRGRLILPRGHVIIEVADTALSPELEVSGRQGARDAKAVEAACAEGDWL